MKEYYNSEKIGISFDSKKDGYWLTLKSKEEGNYFIDNRAFEDLKTSEAFSLFNKLDAYDDRITESIMRNNVRFPEIKKAIDSVIEKEEKEFAEFKKANNL